MLVLRKGSTSAERLVVAPPPATAAKTTEAYATIRVQRVPYHHGHVAILSLLDVPDDLGVEMASALAEARLEPGLPRGARARARWGGSRSSPPRRAGLSCLARQPRKGTRARRTRGHDVIRLKAGLACLTSVAACFAYGTGRGGAAGGGGHQPLNPVRER